MEFERIKKNSFESTKVGLFQAHFSLFAMIMICYKILLIRDPFDGMYKIKNTIKKIKIKTKWRIK